VIILYHRIQVIPGGSGMNETWNIEGRLDSQPGSAYCSPELNDLQDFRPANNLYEEYFRKIAIDIVIETIYDYPSYSLSEKILRPIVNRKMFIMVGKEDTLAYLKELGFVTFEPFINETYDTIQDPVNRMIELHREIERICSIPLDTVQQTVLKYQDKFEYNYLRLQELEQQELERFQQQCKI